MADQPIPDKRISANAVVAPDPAAKLLTVGESAFELRVSTTTVRRLVDQGQIAEIAVMGRTLIARADLEVFIVRSRVVHVADSDALVLEAAAEKARQSKQRRAMVVADWNKGKDYFGDDDLPPRRGKRRHNSA